MVNIMFGYARTAVPSRRRFPMPGPAVHFTLTTKEATAAGFDPAEAEAIARGDVGVDLRTPGRKYWWLHFNPTASLIFAPLELRRALRADAAGDRAGALEHLGRCIHMRQDAIGHGRFVGLNHLLYDAKLFGRHPDDWETMPPVIQQRIVETTRDALRRFTTSSAKQRAV